MTARVAATIRGTEYAVIKLDPLRGGRLAAQVGQLLAAALADQGAIAQLVDAFKRQGEGAAADALSEPQLLAALAGGVKNLDADRLYGIAIEFAQGKVFAGERKLHDDHAFNAHFAEHPDHLFPVLVLVLRANCAGFFGLGAKA